MSAHDYVLIFLLLLVAIVFGRSFLGGEKMDVSPIMTIPVGLLRPKKHQSVSFAETRDERHYDVKTGEILVPHATHAT